jgi:hypothetical protein
MRESLVVFLPTPKWQVGICFSFPHPYVICSDAFAIITVDLRASSLLAWISRLPGNRIFCQMFRNGPCLLQSMV